MGSPVDSAQVASAHSARVVRTERPVFLRGDQWQAVPIRLLWTLWARRDQDLGGVRVAQKLHRSPNGQWYNTNERPLLRDQL